MKKKILSLILALTVIVSATPVLAVTEIPAADIIEDIFRFDVGEFSGEGTGDISDDPDVKRIEFLDAIGVWDDKSIPKTSLLTMTEFSVIMSKVKLGSENALLDVYGQDPDDTKVTYRNVIEYILHATGYYHRCAQYGNTDEALLIVAADIGLISRNPENIGAFISRGELAKYITKALTLDMCIMEHTSDGGYKYTVTPGKNLLSNVHSIYDVGGFVNAIPGLAVYGGASLKKGYIQIERTNINASGMNASEYFGMRVDAYAFFDDTTDEYSLIYIAEAEDNNIMELDFHNIIKINGDEISYVDDNETEYEVSVGNLANVVENGKKLTSLSEMCDFKNSDGKIVLTASARRGEFDTAIIYRYDYFVVDYVDTFEKKIGLKYGMTYNGDTFIGINDKAINSITVDGTEADYTEISVNKAIRVMGCEETGYLQIVQVSDKHTGNVTMAYDDMLGFGGKTYRISRNILNRVEECKSDSTLSYNDKLRIPELGAAVTAYIIDDVIAGYSFGNEYMYGYLKSASLSRTSIDPTLTLRVFTQDNEFADMPFADKLTLDSVQGVTKKDASQFIIDNSDAVVGELIRFKINGEGLCTALDTIIESDAEKESTDDIAYVPEYENGVFSAYLDWTRWNLRTSGGSHTIIRYLLKENAPLFVVPLDESMEKDYSVSTVSSLTTGEDYDLVLYNPDEFNHLNVVLYRGDLGDVSGGDTISWLYVENMRRVIIDKDKQEYGYKVTGMQYINQRAKGKGVCQETSYYVTDELYEEAIKNGTEFKVGDFIRYNSVKTNITSWKFEYGIERGSTKITLEPGVYDIGTIGGNSYDIYVGRVKRVNAAEQLMMLDCGDAGDMVISPRAKGIIDVSQKITINASISDYHAGDMIYAFCGGANASFIFKNVNE